MAQANQKFMSHPEYAAPRRRPREIAILTAFPCPLVRGRTSNGYCQVDANYETAVKPAAVLLY